MKRLLFCVGMGILLVTSVASGQSRTFRAEVPFNFHVGSIHMSADQYKLNMSNAAQGIVRIIAHDSSAVSFSCAIPKNTSPTDKAKLVFKRYGDDYFLSEIHFEDGFQNDRIYMTSEHEKEANEALIKKTASGKAQPQLVEVALKQF